MYYWFEEGGRSPISPPPGFANELFFYSILHSSTKIFGYNSSLTVTLHDWTGFPLKSNRPSVGWHEVCGQIKYKYNQTTKRNINNQNRQNKMSSLLLFAVYDNSVILIWSLRVSDNNVLLRARVWEFLFCLVMSDFMVDRRVALSGSLL